MLPSISIHLNDNAWAVRDLNVNLSPVIIKQTEAPAEAQIPVETVSPLPEETETSAPAETAETPTAETEGPLPVTETEEPTPEIEIPLTVYPVKLTPSIIDAAGNSLIYGSTLYVGEDYTLRIASDTEMNDSVAVNVTLPLNSPLDPMSGCLDYMSSDGMGLSIPGSSFYAGNGNTFSCGLRFNDSGWFGGTPIVFSIETVRSAEYGYGMDPLNWSYYPVNVAKMAATHQLQVADGRGNLICSDNVPCSVFSADEVYTLTYKFPADWGTAMPSGKCLSASVTLPPDWAFGLQTADELAMSGEFGEPCMVNPDGTVDLFLEETGAEYVGRWFQWIYSRKRSEFGSFDVYSDIDSRIDHLNRIGHMLVLVGGANLLIGLMNSFNGSRIGWLNLVCATVLMYGLGRMHGKKEALEKERLLHE